MTGADIRAGRGTRLGVVVFVALLHLATFFALLRAFAPDLTRTAVDNVVAAFSVTVTTPPPPPPEPSPDPVGAAAPTGKKAIPRDSVAPRPKVVVTRKAAPPSKGAGSANAAGAAPAGAGQGAGGQGAGLGSGSGGSGTGTGAASKPIKIAGDIAAARDYPRKGRDLRIGDYAIVVMTVGTDGRARDCRIQRASRDPAADALTCRFAEQRFRFTPAMDAAGNPVAAQYGWRQRWF